jgi:hypothetical protein
MNTQRNQPTLPSEYLEQDHRRLEGLFIKATLDPAAVDMEIYDQFRTGLLRHIGIEEKIVLPLLRTALSDGYPKEAQIRLDHGAIAALLVPPPEAQLIFALTALLQRHNHLEEDPGTLYDMLDDCARREDPSILDRIIAHPAVPLSRYINNPDAMDAVRRAVARSGHDYAELVNEGQGRIVKK